MSEQLAWKRDEQKCAYVCSDGRAVTDEQLTNLDPVAAGLLKQVLDEAVSKPAQPIEEA